VVNPLASVPECSSTSPLTPQVMDCFLTFVKWLGTTEERQTPQWTDKFDTLGDVRNAIFVVKVNMPA